MSKLVCRMVGAVKPLCKKPVPSNLNYDMWLGPAPWREHTGFGQGIGALGLAMGDGLLGRSAY